MIHKLLEALFRHKLLLLLPPILIPAIVGPIALMNVPVSYDTTMTVWVDHAAYLNYQDGSNPWVSPSQIQSGRLSELLGTRAFQMDVAKRTSLAPLIGSIAGEQRIQTLIAKTVTLGRAGDHVLTITVQGPTPQLSYELDTAIVDAYQEKTASDQADQAGVAAAFYQQRVQEAEQQFAAATSDLRRYIATQSAASSSSGLADTSLGSLPAATALDPKLSGLQSAFNLAQGDVNSARSSLAAAQRDASAAMQGQQLGFQILDQARMPTTATRQLKKMLIYPLAALVAGLGLSAALLVVLVAGDRSVRSESDLAPGVRVLGVVPSFKLKRIPRKLRTVATRRAIGAAAGTALPAPVGAK